MVNSDQEDDETNEQIDGYLKHFVQRGRGPSKSKRLVKEEAKRNLLAIKSKVGESNLQDGININDDCSKDSLSKVGKQ